MTVKLRISSRDGRALNAGAPYCLVDRSSDEVVSLHRSHAGAMRTLVTLTQIGSDSCSWGFTAAQILRVAESVCERLYPGRGVDELYGTEQAKVIAEARRSLR